MDVDVPTPQTLLDAFLQLASAPDAAARHVVECGADAMTYAELRAVARGLALALSDRHAVRPTVAVVSENHPYVFAVIFATWMLGGIVAPLDHHAPEVLLRAMLENIRPDCVVLPSSNAANLAVVQGCGYPTHVFDPSTSSIPHLIRQFGPIDRSTSTPLPHPSAADTALYIHTSSASSVSTLKCVPLTHASIHTNCATQLAWLRAAFPATRFARLRVLGWGPWAHIMGVSHDIGAHCVLTGGCYVFGVVPATYPAAQARPAVDVGRALLDAAVASRATAFAGVPWVIRKFMEEEKAARGGGGVGGAVFAETLRGFKVIISGGANTDEDVVRWAKETGVNLVIGIGMTELGGPIFHTRAGTSTEPGWALSSSLVPDAEFTLIDDTGTEAEEGELHIRSALISTGYLHRPSPAFSRAPDGTTSFRTGDLYARRGARLVWRARREDYITLRSGEQLDPRGAEAQLARSPAIARACLVGDAFLRTSASACVCALLEPRAAGGGGGPDVAGLRAALAAVNRALAPPLRVPWARALVLAPGERIPVTRKGGVWRKALEAQFGDRLRALLAAPALSRLAAAAPAPERPRQSETDVEAAVVAVVAEVLGLERAVMEQHFESTFAELGMDSQMAVRIVNGLNSRLGLQLPQNACHDYVDLSQLSKAISVQLGIAGAPAMPVPPASLQASPEDDVVIIGQAFRLPGDINTPEAFWAALVHQRTDLLGAVPADRWDHASFYEPGGARTPGAIAFDTAGFIDVARFDNAFFGIAPAEAPLVAPAPRLALEAAVGALEHANVPPAAVRGTDMGVFVAVAPDDGYAQLLFADRGYAGYTRFYGSGVASSTASGRLSYFLDVHGPSVSLDTACSGGMVALDNAVQHIKRGDGESAIVCSVNVHLWPGIFSFLSANQMASTRGRCTTFTSEADGYAPSEGVVAFVLKSKSSAIRDGDNILGVIRSTSVKHNGRSQGLIAPNAQAQANLQRTLIAKAHLRPSDIDFVETHGTGTILGDLVEMQAINEVFAASHSVDRPLYIGASKTVFGHTESSAGLVGVAKTLLSFSTSLVPGLAHLNRDNLNPNINTTLCPLAISHSNQQMSRRTSGSSPVPLRALTLAYGFAGTISGVVLEEYVPQPAANGSGNSSPVARQTPLLFTVSAKTAKALREYLSSYIDFCAGSREADLADICYTSCVGREHYRFRFVVVVHTLSELLARLRAALSSLSESLQPINARPRLILGFPGQGSQYQGMARTICLSNAGFDAILRKAALDASRLLGTDILPFLVDEHEPDSSGINQTHIAQVCIFVFQYAMFEWLRELGVHPQGVLPHSVGEVAAAVASQAISFDTGLEFIILRALSMQPDPERPGAMAAVTASEREILAAIGTLKLQQNVCIAGFNSPNRHVVSGDAWAVEKLVSALSCQKIRCVKVDVNQGFHSHCIDQALEPIRNWLEAHTEEFSAPTARFYSSALGDIIQSADNMGPDYWINQARGPILFAAAAEKASRDQATIVVDVGPQPVLSVLLREIPGCETTIVASLTARRGKDTDAALFSGLAALHEHGIAIDFKKFFEGRHETYRKVSLPTYPWQRVRHYPSVIPSRTKAVPHEPKQHNPNPKHWIVDDALLTLLRDHSANSLPIMPAAGMVLSVAQAGRNVSMRILKPLVLRKDAKIQVNTSSADCLSYTISFHGTSSTSDIVCSGTFCNVANSHQADCSIGARNTTPDSVMSKHEIYSRLSGGRIAFGPSFQNISEIRIWEDLAEGIIEVEPSTNPKHNLIRQLDACLHMFGAFTPVLPFENGHRRDGSFLPSSLAGLTLYANSFPRRFTCRYRLPVKIEKNFRKMMTSFELISDAGDLLASCDDYSVAWIPAIVPFIQDHTEYSDYLMRTVWINKSLPLLTEKVLPSEKIIYVGPKGGLRDAIEKQAFAQRHEFVALDLSPPYATLNGSAANCVQTSDFIYPPHDLSSFYSLICNADNRFSAIIYDAILPDGELSVQTVTHYSNAALNFMKAISELFRSPTSTSVIFLTTWASPILSEDMSGVSPLAYQEGPTTSLRIAGSLIQGMVRVFRQEYGIQNVWGLDVPPTLQSTDLASRLFQEIGSRACGVSSPVAYRFSEEGQLMRLTSFLQRERQVDIHMTSPEIDGRAVIIGMGDIGTALAGNLIEAGHSGVTFIGRRSECDSKILLTLRQLRRDYPRASFSYISASVASYESLKTALAALAADSALGTIHTIVHTAGIIKDSLIKNTSKAEFQEILSPKVWGSWNIHLACHELQLNIRRFVILSSISVPLGNPGQVSYVAANSFLDALAAFRKDIHPETRTVSLQLGAWESHLVKGMQFDDAPVGLMTHKEGIPLLLQAMAGNRAIQILAKLRAGKMQNLPAYSTDPYFTDFLGNKPEGMASNKTLSRVDIANTISTVLNEILEVTDNEPLDLGNPLSSFGLDSIAFTQLRAALIKQLGVNIPMSLFGEDCTAGDITDYILKARAV